MAPGKKNPQQTKQTKQTNNKQTDKTKPQMENPKPGKGKKPTTFIFLNETAFNFTSQSHKVLPSKSISFSSPASSTPFIHVFNLKID